MTVAISPLRHPHELGLEVGRFRLAGRIRRAGPTILVADAFAQVEVMADANDALTLVHDALCVLEIDRATPDAPARVVHVVKAATPASASRDTTRLLDLGVGRNLRARDLAIRAVRDHFASHGFVEVDTPRMVVSPGLDVHLSAFETGPADVNYLITSPEYQMKRLLVGGVPRCFQITPCFRRDEEGRDHNPEFTMLEWYRAFEDVDAVLADTEQVVVAAAAALGKTVIETRGRTIPLVPPFPRLTVAEAFRAHAGIDEATMLALANREPEAFYRVLCDRVEPALARVETPVFLTRYPRPFASLARLADDDPRYAERFELYVAGVELCNGFGELTSPEEQRARFVADQAERRAAGLPVYPIDERFLDALSGGMPDAAGNALGLDRLVALVCGAPDLGSVMAFPASEL